MDKSLKYKAIKIQGKSYVLVSDRVIYFNDNYQNGSITTVLISGITSEEIIIRATITPDTDKPERYFTGYSQAIKGQGYINKTSALENAETSAVGRALAMMGIGVIDSIASIDEINKTTHYPKTAEEKERYGTKYVPVIPQKKTIQNPKVDIPFIGNEFNTNRGL